MEDNIQDSIDAGEAPGILRMVVRWHGFERWSDFARMTKREFNGIKHIGPVRRDAILRALAQRGIQFHNDDQRGYGTRRTPRYEPKLCPCCCA
jgi:hypothetical protein